MRKISVFAFAMIFAACQSQRGENGSFGIYTADCEDVCYDEEMPVMASAKAAPMMRNSMAGGQLEDAVEQDVTQ